MKVRWPWEFSDERNSNNFLDRSRWLQDCNHTGGFYHYNTWQNRQLWWLSSCMHKFVHIMIMHDEAYNSMTSVVERQRPRKWKRQVTPDPDWHRAPLAKNIRTTFLRISVAFDVIFETIRPCFVQYNRCSFLSTLAIFDRISSIHCTRPWHRSRRMYCLSEQVEWAPLLRWTWSAVVTQTWLWFYAPTTKKWWTMVSKLIPSTTVNSLAGGHQNVNPPGLCQSKHD